MPIGDHPQTRRQQARDFRPKECCTPGCIEPPAEGRRFCESHQIRLDLVREAMAAEGQIRKRSAFGSITDGSWRARRTKQSPICCNIGCFNERVPPETYCPTCQASGDTQGDD